MSIAIGAKQLRQKTDKQTSVGPPRKLRKINTKPNHTQTKSLNKCFYQQGQNVHRSEAIETKDRQTDKCGSFSETQENEYQTKPNSNLKSKQVFLSSRTDRP